MASAYTGGWCLGFVILGLQMGAPFLGGPFKGILFYLGYILGFAYGFLVGKLGIMYLVKINIYSDRRRIRNV